MEMITKAKHNIPSDFSCKDCPKNCPECPEECPECPTERPECPTEQPECPKDFPECPECAKIKATDCADLFNMGTNKSGVYEVWPISRLLGDKPITVFCDMDTDGGGWTVIQRRGDFGSPKDYFYKDWKSYKEGFGRIEKDFWLGNDNIFALSSQKRYSVRFDLMDVQKNRRYAVYDTFWISDEDGKYTLHILGYSGNADNAMHDHNNQPFSTKDRKNDYWVHGNCAEYQKGGWWYHTCGNANLNGLYHKGTYTGKEDGVVWKGWKKWNESLEWTEIKIRPKSFKA